MKPASFCLCTILWISLFFTWVSYAAEQQHKSPSWRPPAVEYDWVQLTSGEWLKGEIKALYNKVLEFDSEKLDLLEIKLKDVAFLQSHINSTVNIEDAGTITGFLQINQDKISITNDGDTRNFDRSKLISFVTGELTESNYWSVKIAIGLNLQRGNSEQSDFSAKANAKRRTARSRIIFDYLGNISQTRSINTQNNHRANVTYDRFKTRHFFYRPVFAEYYRDPFQNVDRKLTLGTGLGYSFIDTTITEWNVFGGPAYQSTRFVTVEAGKDINESTPALILGTDFDTELTSRLDFMIKYNIRLGNEKNGGYTHHAIATFEHELTGSLDFDISFVWDRITYPTAAEDGSTPAKDDYKMLLSIGYTY